MLQVQLQGKTMSMMVDTGAMCVKASEGCHLPKFVAKPKNNGYMDTIAVLIDKQLAQKGATYLISYIYQYISNIVIEKAHQNKQNHN